MKVLACVAVVMAAVISVSDIPYSSSELELAADPDTKLDFMGMCRNHGYDVESYTVTTEDGYQLLVFRIPNGKATQDEVLTRSSAKPVVFLQHGILDSADTWVNNSPDLAPAFILADAGYDVWVGNSRGNYYSRHNTKLDPDKDKEAFWDFSWTDMGLYDLPAVITKALDVSGAKKLSYIGHSQGTTQMFYALSKNEDYFLERVNLFVALGPVTNLANGKSELLSIVAQLGVQYALKFLGFYEVFWRNYTLNSLYSVFCGAIPSLCNLGLFLIADEDTSVDNSDRLNVMFAHFPSGSSLKSFIHYSQSIKTKTFREYDYGKEENIKRYGQDPPPDIPLYNIKSMPIALFVGEADELATTEDSKWLINSLGVSVVEDDDIPKEGHMTFLMGKDESYLNDVISLIEKYK